MPARQTARRKELAAQQRAAATRAQGGGRGRSPAKDADGADVFTRMAKDELRKQAQAGLLEQERVDRQMDGCRSPGGA